MNTNTTVHTPTSHMLLEREDAMRDRAQAADFEDSTEYAFSKAAQLTYAQAYAEYVSPYVSPGSPSWSERTATATEYLLDPTRFVWSVEEPEAVAKGRDFALSICRGLQIK